MSPSSHPPKKTFSLQKCNRFPVVSVSVSILSQYVCICAHRASGCSHETRIAEPEEKKREETKLEGFEIGKKSRKKLEKRGNAMRRYIFSDLMNDWEIGGTQNKWVCPSDRHLHLRAQ